MQDLDLARVCASSYDTFTRWDHLWNGDIYAGLIGDILCFRGSVTVDDWMDDLDAFAVEDPKLGGLHAGFAKGLAGFFAQTAQHLSPSTRICGHSLGAARALIFAGYMEQAGIRPAEVVVFGSPRPGMKRLSDILVPVTVHSYKNRFDPVTAVPVAIYPDLPYIHPRRAIELDAAPPLDDFSPFADHNIALYVRALENGARDE